MPSGSQTTPDSSGFTLSDTLSTDQRLYVYGEEFSGSVTFTFASDTLTVNGSVCSASVET